MMKLFDAINRVSVIAMAVGTCALAVSGPAQAHDVVAGVGGFWGGLAHPLLVPAHALALVALGLAVGQASRHRAAELLFASGLVAGIALIVAAFAIVTDQAILVVAAVAGLATAIGRPLPLLIAGPLAIAGGTAIALDSVPQEISMLTTFLALIGTALSACAAVVALAELMRRLTRGWQRVGLRILGSWAAASAILVLGLRLIR